MPILLLLNNPTIPMAILISGCLVLVWLAAFVASWALLKRDPAKPLRIFLISFITLLIVIAPILLYVVVTLFVLTDFK